MKSEMASKLRILRKGRGLTQQELADRLNLNRATICNYEVGRRTPHLSELKVIADYYGVGLDYFGVANQDEVFELISRARNVFENQNISKEQKEDLYKELLKLYLSIEN